MGVGRGPDALRAGGHDVTAVTLPGLESADADRSAITLSDHVAAICEAVRAAGAPVVLAVPSGAGGAGYGASDRVPELIAAMVYVDSGPATAALDPDFGGVEMQLPAWEEFAEDPGNSIEGLTAEQLETFRRRAVPEPGAAFREAPVLTNDARLDVPTILVCTSLSSEQIKGALRGGYAWVGGSCRAARHHLRRPADEPLADVVAPTGSRRDYRRCCESSRLG